MAEEKQLTFKEVAEHSTKRDLYVVIHDKVYDVTTFVDEHPGGEEVLLDVAGQDSTEAFEDVGHSDEAREILDGLKVASLKRVPGDPAPHAPPASAQSSAAPADSTGTGVGIYAGVVLVAAVAYGLYQYLCKVSGVEP